MNYNPLLPEVRENPHPDYAYLREHAAVYIEKIVSIRQIEPFKKED